METFLFIIKILVTGAVVITAVRMYFLINKMWKRKSDQEVCNSISIFSYTLAVCVHTPFMLKFALIDKNYVLVANDAIQIISYLLVILIGTGFWVRANRQFSIMNLIKKALRLERKESGELVMSLIRPKGAKTIIRILEKVACLDNDLSEGEIKLVREFAKNWNIDLTNEAIEEWKHSEQTSLLDLRNSLERYLNKTPPSKQASELLDLIALMIKADNVITMEEQIFLDEARGIINNYILHEDTITMYEVLLVPQRKSKIKTLLEIFPDIELVSRRGGNVHIQGQYYSKEFAEAICKKYIELGIFSIWEEVEIKKYVEEPPAKAA